MVKIGLTGNIAAGKSFVENIFKNLGIKTISADNIVHNLYKNDVFICNKIAEIFKNYDIFSDNKIDRNKLGKIIFSNNKKKIELENLIHNEVIKKISNFFNQNKNENIIVVEIPLLFENHFENIFDKIILVYANDNLRFERIKKRNNFDDNYIKKIMNSQINQDLKKEKSDFIIINENKTIKDLKKEIQNLIEKL